MKKPFYNYIIKPLILVFTTFSLTFGSAFAKNANSEGLEYAEPTEEREVAQQHNDSLASSETIPKAQERDYDHYLYFDNMRVPPEPLKIPEEIVKAKDCEAFLKWQYDTFFTLLPIQKCPWYAYNPEREITIDSLTLKIPRNFLTAGGEVELDGVATAIGLDFTYPEIKGGLGNGRSFVLVFMKSVKSYLKESKKSEQEYLIDDYWHSFLRMDVKKDEYLIIDKGFNEQLNRKHYVIRKFSRPVKVSKGYISDLRTKSLWSEEKIAAHVKILENIKTRDYYTHIYIQMGTQRLQMNL